MLRRVVPRELWVVRSRPLGMERFSVEVVVRGAERVHDKEGVRP
jgi:hypothetical protein